LFTVKSAYDLAINLKWQGQSWGASSNSPSGDRQCWKVIWSSSVPPKVKLTVWKIYRNALATQSNMQRRGMATSNICTICGCEEEDTFHVFMRCTHARSLWLAKREIWELPTHDTIKPTWSEWLLCVLNEASETKRVNMMMIPWRIWHNHNEITHDKPYPSIKGSRRFLSSYLDSLLMIKQFPEVAIEKGKMIIDPRAGFCRIPTIQNKQQKTKQNGIHRWRDRQS
jgi:hypothetical protein